MLNKAVADNFYLIFPEIPLGSLSPSQSRSVPGFCTGRLNNREAVPFRGSAPERLNNREAVQAGGCAAILQQASASILPTIL